MSGGDLYTYYFYYKFIVSVLVEIFGLNCSYLVAMYLMLEREFFQVVTWIKWVYTDQTKAFLLVWCSFQNLHFISNLKNVVYVQARLSDRRFIMMIKKEMKVIETLFNVIK